MDGLRIAPEGSFVNKPMFSDHHLDAFALRRPAALVWLATALVSA